MVSCTHQSLTGDAWLCAPCVFDLMVHGSLQIFFTSRDFLVYSYDMLRTYWKIVGEFRKLLKQDQTDIAYPTAKMMQGLAKCEETAKRYTENNILLIVREKREEVALRGDP